MISVLIVIMCCNYGEGICDSFTGKVLLLVYRDYGLLSVRMYVRLVPTFRLRNRSRSSTQHFSSLSSGLPNCEHSCEYAVYSCYCYCIVISCL